MLFSEVAPYLGLVASLWITVGVIIAARHYPGYSHARQFCSELGASGSPTEKLSPTINNYPLSLLFGLFGLHIIDIGQYSILVILTGVMILIHGIGTAVAGYFPMDKDPYTKTPSRHCKIHSWAGFIMLLALLIAPLLMLFSPQTPQITLPFKAFSLFCLLASLFFMVEMAKAVKRQTNPGTHQRLSYGAQLLWLSGLSWALAN